MTTGDKKKTSEPIIPPETRYRYLYRAMDACYSHLGLDAVQRSVQYVISKQATPEEIKSLVAYGQARRQAISLLIGEETSGKPF